MHVFFTVWALTRFVVRFFDIVIAPVAVALVAVLPYNMSTTAVPGEALVYLLASICIYAVQRMREPQVEDLVARPPLTLQLGDKISTDKFFLAFYSGCIFFLRGLQLVMIICQLLAWATPLMGIVWIYVLLTTLFGVAFEALHVYAISSAMEHELLELMLGTGFRADNPSGPDQTPGCCHARWRFIVTKQTA